MEEATNAEKPAPSVETEKVSESHTPSPDKVGSMAATLPNTGEADLSLIFGTAALSILAGLGLYSKKEEY